MAKKDVKKHFVIGIVLKESSKKNDEFVFQTVCDSYSEENVVICRLQYPGKKLALLWRPDGLDRIYTSYPWLVKLSFQEHPYLNFERWL